LISRLLEMVKLVVKGVRVFVFLSMSCVILCVFNCLFVCAKVSPAEKLSIYHKLV